jgi:hypothetical protein
MPDNTARNLPMILENFVFIHPKNEVWFKLCEDVFVGEWTHEESGELSIRNIKATPYYEVPFVMVNLAR